MSTRSAALVDEHAVIIGASRAAAWPALERMVERAAPGRFAWFLGCVDTEASGPRPLATGSTVPGFRVVAVDEPGELALAGRHRYSEYELVFRLDDLGDSRSCLRAETRADFPGIAGRLYRTMLVGTRAHVIATRRMLATVKRDAEASVT